MFTLKYTGIECEGIYGEMNLYQMINKEVREEEYAVWVGGCLCVCLLRGDMHETTLHLHVSFVKSQLIGLHMT